MEYENTNDKNFFLTRICIYIYFIAWPNLRQQQSFNYSFEWQSHAIYKSVVSGTKKLGLLLVFEFQGKSSFIALFQKSAA